MELCVVIITQFMKAIFQALALGILLSSSFAINAQQNQYLNFYPWVNGAVSGTMTSDANPDQFGAKTGCITGDITASLSGGSWLSTYPKWTNTAPATWSSSFGFEMNVDWTNTSQTATLTIDFKKAGSLIELPIEFFLSDVNASACASTAANRFIDVVSITGYKANLSTVLYPNLTTTCGSNAVGGANNNIVYGNPSCGSNASGASVVFTPAKKIARLVITYSSGTGTPVNLAPCAPFPLNAGENPKSQYIRISSIKLNYDCVNNIILPVTLSEFDATCEQDQVALNWTTEREQNNQFFTLERSENGYDFTPIGQVNGSGTTTDFTAYTFADKTPLQGMNYYRLKQTDIDGTQTIIGNTSVFCNAPESQLLYNAETNVATLHYSVTRPTDIQLSVITMNGNKVLNQNARLMPEDEGFSFSTNSLATGSYLVCVKTEFGQDFYTKLVVW